MTNATGGFSWGPNPEVDREYQKTIHKSGVVGSWEFWCQGACHRRYSIREVSETAMRVKAEQYGFKPSGESFICDDCEEEGK